MSNVSETPCEVNAIEYANYAGPKPTRTWTRSELLCNNNTYTTAQLNENKKKQLSYINNSANLTKSQKYSGIVRGVGPNGNKVWATQGMTYTDPNVFNLPQNGNTLSCPGTVIQTINGIKADVQGGFGINVNAGMNAIEIENAGVSSVQSGAGGTPYTGAITVSAGSGIAITDPASGTIEIRNTMSVPEFTIVSYLLQTAPTGWQLCDGFQLLSINNIAVYNSDGVAVKTPDLRGRTVLGVNYPNIYPNNNNNLTQTSIGQSGGEEQHLLSVNEMPSHTHGISPNAMADRVPDGGGYNNDGNAPYGNATIDNAGGSQPHNNMPPIFVLNYIIKQPSQGGLSFPIIYPSQTPNTLF